MGKTLDSSDWLDQNAILTSVKSWCLANRNERSEISLVGATEALKMVLGIGVENIERRILKLTGYLIDAVKGLGLKLQTPEELQCRSGIVNFKIDKPQEVAEKLKNKGTVISARSHGIRVSPHFYNTEEEIDRLIEEIKQCG